MTEDKGQSKDVQPEEEQVNPQEQTVEKQPTAREFLSLLFSSPGQREMAEQLDRDIRSGKFQGDLLAVARRVVGLTGDASYLLSHQNEIDLANTLFEIPPMPQQEATTAEELTKVEDPIVAAFTNIHESKDMNDRPVRTAHVALIRKGENGKLRVEAPQDGEPRHTYERYALRATQPPLPGGPSWGAQGKGPSK